MIRVGIAEDHPELRVVLRLLIGLSVDMELIWEAANGQEALEAVQHLPPEVLVMDVQMPVLDGWTTTKKIAELGLQTRVILISGYPGSYVTVKSAEVGAKGFVLKDHLAEQLPEAIKAVARGETFF